MYRDLHPVRGLVGTLAALTALAACPGSAGAAGPAEGRRSEAPEAEGADPERSAPSPPGLDPAAHRAVQQGLAYLARRQNRDGSWTDRVGRKVYTNYQGREAEHVGVTALAGIAFLSNGVVPGGGHPGTHWRSAPGAGGRTGLVLAGRDGYRDRDGNRVFGWEIVAKALDYTIEHTSPTGFISHNGSRMYSHAFAALFLAEAYGMGYSRGGRLKRALRRAISMIESSQNDQGGWRYRPQSEDSDMSITVCQVMALRAARNAGVGVSKDVIDKAVLYVRRSFIPAIGAFTYQLGPEFRGAQSRHSFALTAAGVTTLYGAGAYDEKRIIQRALRYLWVNRPRRTEARYKFDYYYGQYYAVQAWFQRGDGEWERWYEDYIKPDLLALQEDDGSWEDLVGSNYATAMAAIILQLPNQYLPITEN